jgi:acyl-CoA synthetase (AMP-forming)/AMP-acid ligase II
MRPGASTVLSALWKEDPNRTALIAPNGPAVTYGSLIEQVERLAVCLQSAGIERGDRIALFMPNGVEAVISFLAAATAATALPLNPAYKREEIQFYMSDANACALIVPAGSGETARQAVPLGTAVIDAHIDDAGRLQFDAAAVTARKSLTPPEPSDVAMILHTSGATSRPKRVPLKHSNLIISAANTASSYSLAPNDVSFCVMPLFHAHGLIGSTLTSLITGGSVVVPSGGFNALAFWPTAKTARVTWYSAVPAIHQMLLSRARGIRPPGSENLRFIRSCSAPLPAAVMADMEFYFGVPVLEAYGMTEAAHQIATNPLPPSRRKIGTVGRGSNVEVRTIDPAGNLLSPGKSGEIVVRGASVITAYEDNPLANASSFIKGWFRTGDEGILDSDYYLTVIGKIGELIVRAGEKISPREVDEVLGLHPAVAEVVTFGVPHKIYGEEVAAAVALKGTASEADLVDFCRERLAEFKCPKKIYIVEKLPRNDAGKIQRRIIAEKILGSAQKQN